MNDVRHLPVRPPLQQLQRNPIQDALDNYRELEARLREVEQRNTELQVREGILVAEVNMLREALDRSEDERVQKTAIAATFVAQAKSLNAILADMIRTANANGIEAIENRHPEETAAADADAARAREIIERTEPAHRTPEPPKVPLR